MDLDKSSPSRDIMINLVISYKDGVNRLCRRNNTKHNKPPMVLFILVLLFISKISKEGGISKQFLNILKSQL